MHNVLTGFKFIGEVIKDYEQKGFGHFILGFEESYGYLKEPTPAIRTPWSPPCSSPK